MKCRKCSQEIYSDAIYFCPTCGTFLVDNQDLKQNKKKKIINFTFLIFLSFLIFWGVVICFVFLFGKTDYYFADTGGEQESSTVSSNEENFPQNNIVTEEGETRILYNNKYERQTIRSIDDVYDKIVFDSISQKSSCSSEIIAIENDIITNYQVKAVNLCEMDADFARELRDVVGYYYNTYPQTRGYMTNMTLANVDNNKTYMAAFMPMFTFMTSNTSTTYPIGLKTQIVLNSKYFLNVNKMKNSVKYGTDTRYFPPHATRSSTVAHEFGHYVSYIALLKYYHANRLTFVKVNDIDLLFSIYDDFNVGEFSYKVLQEAYLQYKKTVDASSSFDQFRESISYYAVTKDSSGAYIYDETIAEAFHDCYLNKDNASIASRIIVDVVVSYL